MTKEQNMKFKKWLAVGAILPALLLTGCFGGGNGEPKPNPTDTTTQPTPKPTDIPTGPDGVYVASSPEELRGYAMTPEVDIITQKYGNIIEFDDTQAHNTQFQVYAAIWTVDQYINKTLDNGYFIANWWGEKDNYSQAGLNDVTKYTKAEAKQSFTAYAATLSNTPGDVKARDWLSNRMFMAPSNPDYMTLDTCENDWFMNACRTSPPKIEKFVATRDNTGMVNVKVTVTIYPVYNQVIDGAAGVEPRVYDFDFTLQPERIPPAFEPKKDAEGNIAQEQEILVVGELDEKATPLYLIKDVTGTMTTQTPTPY